MDKAQAKIFSDGIMGKEIGGWTIKGKLGFGKSAVVFEGEKAGISAAVKIFHPELIERYGKEIQLARIEREKLLIGKSHQNLVQIIDGGDCKKANHLYVVMEKLPWKNLQEANTSVPQKAIKRIIAQLASAARFLEENGLVHRDIKPENIAISEDFSTIKLLDFGVIRPFGDASLTDADQRPFIGTLRYSPPEFLRRDEHDTTEGWRAVTFYQIGAVLHDLLMGYNIFQDASEPYALLVEAVNNETPKISGYDSRLVSLAKRALVKKPEVRLSLLKWIDFDIPDEPEHLSSAELMSKIRKRQTMEKTNSPYQNRSEAEKKRMLEQTIIQLSGKFDTKVASIISKLNIFPLRNIETKTFENGFSMIVRFEIDISLGFSHYLYFEFYVQNFGSDGGIELFGSYISAAIANTEIKTFDFVAKEAILTGYEDDILNEKFISDKVIEKVDKYFNAIDSGYASIGSIMEL